MSTSTKLNSTALTNQISTGNSFWHSRLNCFFVNYYNSGSPESISRIELNGSITFDNTSTGPQQYFQLFADDGTYTYLCHDIGGITKVNESTGSQTNLTTSSSNGSGGFIYNPTKNNLYRTQYWANQIETTTLGGSVSTTSSVGTNPRSIDYDTSGNMYICYDSSGVIRKYDGTTVSTFATISSVTTNTFAKMNSSRDYLYVLSSAGVYGLHKIQISTGTVTTIKTFSDVPTKFDLDSSGNAYVTFNGTGDIKMIDISGNLTTLDNITNVFDVFCVSNILYTTVNNSTDGKYIWKLPLSTFNIGASRRRLL